VRVKASRVALFSNPRQPVWGGLAVCGQVVSSCLPVPGFVSYRDTLGL